MTNALRAPGRDARAAHALQMSILPWPPARTGFRDGVDAPGACQTHTAPAARAVTFTVGTVEDQ
ncbi:MAG: hypothetical protein SGI90_16715 [Candidatus Eisenbacteria bacterium]|nr:hypothetical protein [Candidatus Eisenbacteria bacterium]